MSLTSKVINLILYDGTLDGEIYIDDKNWTHSGELYAYPRASAKKPIDGGITKKSGVYLLLSPKTVYVGQSKDLAQRINQHLKGKDWWTKTVILTSSKKFTKTDIDYLEYVLIEKAFENGTLDCDNKRKEQEPVINKTDVVTLDQYLEEALFLLQLIGITVFREEAKKPNPKRKKSKDTSPKSEIRIDELTVALLEAKRKTAEAKQFLSFHEIAVGNIVTYASRQEDEDEFWANPTIKHLTQDWDIILNDNKQRELILLHVPANSEKLAQGTEKGLFTRKDKPGLIDLNLAIGSLVDKRSGISFSRYIIHRISY